MKTDSNSLMVVENPRFKDTQDTALILEGGGFRGIYTAGILDRFLEENIHFPYVIGVSMGAIIGMSYVSDQHRRMIEWCARYIPDKKYMSISNLLKEGNFFSHDYGFNREARRFLPFDFKSFYSAPEKFYFTATNVETGQAEYIEKKDGEVVNLALATTALPMMSRLIEVNDQKYLDGGVADPIPIDKSLLDGNKKLVVVLTRPKGYRKKKDANNPIGNYMYRDYPNLLETYNKRVDNYNKTLDQIEQLEKEGKAFVFYVNEDADTTLIQRDPEVLNRNYQYGYNQADARIDELKEFLKK